MAGDVFPYFGASSKRFNISKVHHQIFRNKRHLTKDISKNASRTLDFLSNVNEMKYKSKKLPKNRQSPEAIQVQLDMSHMRSPSQLSRVLAGLFSLSGRCL